MKPLNYSMDTDIAWHLPNYKDSSCTPVYYTSWDMNWPINMWTQITLEFVIFSCWRVCDLSGDTVRKETGWCHWMQVCDRRFHTDRLWTSNFALCTCRSSTRSYCLKVFTNSTITFTYMGIPVEWTNTWLTSRTFLCPYIAFCARIRTL